MQKRRDANQPEVIALFRQLGCSVADVTQGESVGFDLLVAVRNHTATIEVKTGPKKKLTPNELEHSRTWHGLHAVVWDDASVATVAMRLMQGGPWPLEWRKPGW